MNSEATAQHLQHLLDHHPDQPLFLLWDRATWHYGPEVKTVLKENARLEVFYFPTAAPDLNLQEQAWKEARAAVSHNHSLKKLSQLADKFEPFLTSISFPSSFYELYALNWIPPGFI